MTTTPDVLSASNGLPPLKQPRLSFRHISTPLLILSVGKTGIFDARRNPLIISCTGLKCCVKVEGCWHDLDVKPSEIQRLLFCEELQVLLLKPHDTLKQSLSLTLKLNDALSGDHGTMKWIILVLGDRMASSVDGNISIQQMELFASAVRQHDGFCKMDCTLMEMRNLLLECGLRLPRAETRLQTLDKQPSQPEAIRQSNVTVHRTSIPVLTATQSKSEGGLLTTVLHTFTSAGLNLFTPKAPSAVDDSVHEAKPGERAVPATQPDDDDIIILSEDNTESDRRSISYSSRSINVVDNARTSTGADATGMAFKFDYHPPGSMDCVSLTHTDLNCLQPGALLNDAIINFYLKYLYFEQLTELQRRATYLFNCFFYSRLVGVSNSQPPAVAKSPAPSALPVSESSLNRHANVAKWTRRVDLFSKDYIIIPINESSHWFLGLVCYPWMAGMVSYTALYSAAAFDLCQLTEQFRDVDQLTFPSTTDEWTVSEEPVERRPTDAKGAAFDRWRRRRLAWLRQRGINAMPCILLFDSLPCQTRVSNLHVIRDYLQVEWDTRRSAEDGPLHFNKDTIRGFSPRVPSQSNLVDCGIYLLHYVEMFFKQPVQSYTRDYFQNEMASWFDEDTVSQKRSDIRALLVRLNAQYQRSSTSTSSF